MNTGKNYGLRALAGALILMSVTRSPYTVPIVAVNTKTVWPFGGNPIDANLMKS